MFAIPIAILLTRVIPALLMTADEINACATIVALKDYRLQGDSEQEAMDSLILDDGLRPDYIAKARSYSWTGSTTCFDRYVRAGIMMCFKRKLLGRPIVRPSLKLGAGQRIEGTVGGRALVKNSARI